MSTFTALPQRYRQRVLRHRDGRLSCWISLLMQCELSGAVTTAHVSQVIDLLIGLSGGAGTPVHYRDLLIRSQASPFTELHLLQQLHESSSSANDSWEVCHEGISLRGRGFADLPALVRSKTAAVCRGANALSFWIHLGFLVSFELVKQGVTFTVFHDEFELQVLLCSVKPPTSAVQQAENIISICNQYWLLKISADAPEAQQTRCANAIGTFSKYLDQYVEFRKG